MAKSTRPAGSYLTRRGYKEEILDEAGDVTGEVEYDDGEEEVEVETKEEKKKRRAAARKRAMQRKKKKQRKPGYKLY